MNSAIQWHPRVAMNHLMRAVAVVTFALTFSATVAAGDVDDLTIITEHYPPYNIQADGSLTGIAVDLMAEILRVLESGRDRESIHLWPWARGYQHVLNKP